MRENHSERGKFLFSCVAACATLAAAPSKAQDFQCDDDVPAPDYSPQEQELVDALWDQTLQYLKGFSTALDEPAGCLDTARAVIQTLGPDKKKKQTRCVERYRDVELVLKHIDLVLENPDAAKKCFSPQKSYDAFQLYSPNAQSKEQSAITKWIDRSTLATFYEGRDGALGEAGRELASDFLEIVTENVSSDFAGADITANGLKDLWSAVGWIPFYADNPDAINDRFRGGYAYAEIMGPWGMLRIKEIDGEPVGAEVGMTVQIADSFYPFHYHHPQEIYMTLSRAACGEGNEYMVGHWDNPLFEQERASDGWRVSVDLDKRERKRAFRRQAPEDEWLTYFERNAIHSFSVGSACGEEGAGGLVTVWARTTARDNNQSTQICRLQKGEAPSEDGGRKGSPQDAYICELDAWAP